MLQQSRHVLLRVFTLLHSYGIVLWELVTGNVPFQTLSASAGNGQLVYSGYYLNLKGTSPKRDFLKIADFVTQGGRLPIPADCPDLIKTVMLKCWRENPNERPSFHTILHMLEEGEE